MATRRMHHRAPPRRLREHGRSAGPTVAQSGAQAHRRDQRAHYRAHRPESRPWPPLCWPFPVAPCSPQPRSSARPPASIGSPLRTPTPATTAPPPLPVWSSDQARHRLSRTGNRQLNAALHRIALTQAHWHPDANDLIARRKAAGDGGLQALRVLKRRLSDVVYRASSSTTITARPAWISVRAARTRSTGSPGPVRGAAPAARPGARCSGRTPGAGAHVVTGPPRTAP